MWGENENPCGYLKDSKIASATPQRRALRCDKAWLRSSVGLYAIAYPKVGQGLRSGVELYPTAYPKFRKEIFCFLCSGVEIYAVVY